MPLPAATAPIAYSLWCLKLTSIDSPKRRPPRGRETPSYPAIGAFQALHLEAWEIAGLHAAKVASTATSDKLEIVADHYQGRSRDGLYEPALADSEREAVADLLQYLENVRIAASYHRDCN